MKRSKISRRSFLLGLGAVSTAALLSACGGSASSSSAASGSAASGSAAAAGSDVFRTLDEIKADGTVNIGVFSDKNPFGYVDENGEYQGYDIYFGNRLGEDLAIGAIHRFHRRQIAVPGDIHFIEAHPLDNARVVRGKEGVDLHAQLLLHILQERRPLRFQVLL